VLSADGEVIGRVDHVLADEQADIFDGLVIDVTRGDGGKRFVDAPEVTEIHEDRVLLSVPAAAVADLPQPQPGPAVLEHHGAEDAESPLQHKLRRAWELISGKG